MSNLFRSRAYLNVKMHAVIADCMHSLLEYKNWIVVTIIRFGPYIFIQKDKPLWSLYRLLCPRCCMYCWQILWQHIDHKEAPYDEFFIHISLTEFNIVTPSLSSSFTATAYLTGSGRHKCASWASSCIWWSHISTSTSLGMYLLVLMLTANIV